MLRQFLKAPHGLELMWPMVEALELQGSIYMLLLVSSLISGADAHRHHCYSGAAAQLSSAQLQQ